MTATTLTQSPALNLPSRPDCRGRPPGVFGCRFGVGALLLAGCLAMQFSGGRCAAESPPAQAPAPVTVAPAANGAPLPPAVRRERPFTEHDLLELLTQSLQEQYVKDRGELEIRLTQPWKTRNVPDEPLTLKVLDMPTMGVTPTFVVRFELQGAHQTLDAWQVAVQARVWRDVWIAHSALKRGEPIAEADLSRERRDILTVREPLAEFAPGDPTLELADSLSAGSLVLARSVKLRPVIHRGQMADALLQSGALSISMKVEVLEDGAPGQIIRVRNSQSRRDIRGKVLNEQTILVSL